MCTYVTTQLCLRKQYGTKLDFYGLLQNDQDLLYKLLENQDVSIPGSSASKIASVVSSSPLNQGHSDLCNTAEGG